LGGFELLGFGGFRLGNHAEQLLRHLVPNRCNWRLERKLASQKSVWYETAKSSDGKLVAVPQEKSRAPRHAKSSSSVIDGFFAWLLIRAVSLISVGGRLGLVFAGADGLSGHVAWIVMKRSRLFFARLL
jgi:hypothetical protein